MEKSLPRVLGELLASRAIDDDTYLHFVRLTLLPHPSQLTDIVAGPRERLFVSSEDVAEFYHSLPSPVTRWKEECRECPAATIRARRSRAAL